MLKHNFGYACCILAISISMPFLIGIDAVEASLDFSFFEEIKEDDSGRLNQKDKYSVNLSLSQPLTDKVTFSEGVRYFKQWVEQEDSQDSISTSMLVNVNADYFIAGLEGDVSIDNDEDGASTDSQTVEFRWESLWDKVLVPDLSFSVSQQNTQDSLSEDSDTERTSSNAALTWAYKYLSVNYTYDRDQTDYVNGVQGSSQENQLAHIQLSGTGWDQRLSARLSHTYTFDSSEQITAADDDNLASISVLISDVRMGLDDPTDTVELASDNTLLHDGDSLTPASPSLAGSTTDHTFLLVVGGQEVDVIYLYTAENLGIGGPVDLLNWRLYSNDILGTSWNEEVLDSAAIDYDSENDRFAIPVASIQQNYLKVVVDRGITIEPPIDFTEVEAAQLIAAAGGTVVSSEYEDSTNSTQFTLGFIINPDLTFGYTSTYRTEESNLDSSPGTQSDTNSVNLSYAPLGASYSSIFSYSLNNDNSEDETVSDRQTRSYGVTVNKTFLPTLEMSVGQTRSESYVEGEKQSLSDTYSLSGTAQLYPDLNSLLDSSYSVGKSFDEEPDSKTLVTKFAITSRIKPLVSLTLSEEYVRNFYDASDDAEELTSTLSGSWRVSDVLSLNTSYGVVDDYSDEPLSQALSINSNLAIGQSIQWSAKYNAAKQEFLTQTVSSDIHWNLSKKVRMRFGADYLFSDEPVAVSTDAEAEASNYLKVFAELTVNMGLPVD